MKIPFNEKELEVAYEIPGMWGGPGTPVYSFPANLFDVVKNTYVDKEATWILLGCEVGMFCPAVIPDNVARGLVIDAVPVPREQFGGKDMFGLNWKYVDVAGGSMSEGLLFDDANDWKDHINFEEVYKAVDSWDWEGSAKQNEGYLASGPKTLWFLNGAWFERLISFMTFEGAAMALLDDDQIDAVKELIHETTSLYMYIVDKCEKYFPKVAGYCIHDDWGSQMAPFFSEEIGREVFLPEMKRFVDHVHSKGKYIEIHSCGKLEKRACVFADAGFDLWSPMDINDTELMFNEQGDRIIIAQTCRELADPDNATEEELREAARSFAKKFAHPDKVATMSAFGAHPAYGSLAFREELYKASRIACCGQE